MKETYVEYLKRVGSPAPRAEPAEGRGAPMSIHFPAADRPATEAAQGHAAVTELCKAIDHMREALWLMPDDDSDLSIAVNHARRTLKEAISIATNGKVQP